MLKNCDSSAAGSVATEQPDPIYPILVGARVISRKKESIATVLLHCTLCIVIVTTAKASISSANLRVSEGVV